jgi:hypothetical protein
VQGQFEQYLNAQYIRKLNYGRCAPHLNDPATLEDFRAALSSCEDSLASYHQDGNRALFDALDARLA